MANTGYILPQSASSTSETGWADAGGAWINPENIYGTGEASITDNAFDNLDASHVLRGYNFNLAAIPTGSTINGVVCRVMARATNPTTAIGLAQLLNTSNARVGTNLAATPITITGTLTPTEHLIGASNNNWGNSLTESWIKNSNFGVGIGVINGANNADVFIDSIELDVYYTAPAQNLTLTCEVTNYTVTGQNVTLTATKNYILSCEVTNYAITPQDVLFTKALTLTCEVTNYTLTGQDATLIAAKNYTLSCELTEYTVTGQDIAFELLRNYILSCQLTEYTITGQDVTLTYAQEVTLLNAIKSLRYSLDGSPWARLATKAGLGVNTLQYSLDGSPWWGVEPSASTWTTYVLKYYTGGTWTTKPLKWHNGSIWVEKDLKKL